MFWLNLVDSSILGVEMYFIGHWAHSWIHSSNDVFLRFGPRFKDFWQLLNSSKLITKSIFLSIRILIHFRGTYNNWIWILEKLNTWLTGSSRGIDGGSFVDFQVDSPHNSPQRLRYRRIWPLRNSLGVSVQVLVIVCSHHWNQIFLLKS